MSLQFIDTHCHLADARLHSQFQAVLDRATAAGVVAFVCASADIEEARRAAELAQRFSGVFFAAGLHPHEAASAASDPLFLKALETLAGDGRCVAIGECGLDYHYDLSPRPDQRRVLAEQLDLARRMGKKVIIHTREALPDTLAILRHCGLEGNRVVFHSFTEGPQEVSAVLDTGAMIGLSGIVTFAKSDALRQAAAAIPADRILIETDSPYLSPEPVRKNKINEPANVPYVAACLAGVRNIPLETLAEQTTANARRFFGLPAAD
ncbi:MAG: TatD family hydrolase [Phycisphaerae bacterium]|jgi:TatD DNase family protein